MKCLVCGKDYDAAECPVCRFPNVQIMGDREQVLIGLKPTIDSYRSRFLKTLQVQLPIYRWKDESGAIALERVDTVTLGTGDALMQEETWLPEKFARIPDEKQICITVRIVLGEQTRQMEIMLPNLHKPELQQLGAHIDDELQLRLLLRNDTESPVASAPIPLFA